MEWSCEAIVLACRPHGDTAAVASLMTLDHGRHAGLVRGVHGRARGLWQPGNHVLVRWRGRLEEHLGTLVGELLSGPYAAVMDRPLRLAGLASACAVVEAALPERAPHPEVFHALHALLATLATAEPEATWHGALVRWELGLLAALGFGLDLGACAATGRNDHLAYVSPKTGRAVSLAAGEPWADRLLALPAFLATADALPESMAATGAGLDLTGIFLEREVFAPMGRDLPPARRHLRSLFAR